MIKYAKELSKIPRNILRTVALLTSKTAVNDPQWTLSPGLCKAYWAFAEIAFYITRFNYMEFIFHHRKVVVAMKNMNSAL